MSLPVPNIPPLPPIQPTETKNPSKSTITPQTPKYVGVTFRSSRIKYQARIYKGNKEYNLGLFDVSADAALAYDAVHRLVKFISRDPSNQKESLKEYEENKSQTDWIDMSDEEAKVFDSDKEKLNFLLPSEFMAARKKELIDRRMILSSDDNSRKSYPSLEELKLIVRKESIRIARVVLGASEGGSRRMTQRKKKKAQKTDEKSSAKKSTVSKDDDAEGGKSCGGKEPGPSFTTRTNESKKFSDQEAEARPVRNTTGVKAYENNDEFYESTGLGKPVPNPPKGKAKKKKNPFGPPPLVPVGKMARKKAMLEKTGHNADKPNRYFSNGKKTPDVENKDKLEENMTKGKKPSGFAALSDTGMPKVKGYMDRHVQNQDDLTTGDFRGRDEQMAMMNSFQQRPLNHDNGHSMMMMHQVMNDCNNGPVLNDCNIDPFFGRMQGALNNMSGENLASVKNNGALSTNCHTLPTEFSNEFIDQGDGFNEGLMGGRGRGKVREFDANFPGGGIDIGTCNGTGPYGVYNGMDSDFRPNITQDTFPNMDGNGGRGRVGMGGGGMFDETAEYQRMIFSRTMGQGDESRGFVDQMQGFDNMTGINQSNYFNSRGFPPDSQFHMQMGTSMSQSSMNMMRIAANNCSDPGSMEQNNYDSTRNQMFNPRTSGGGGSRFPFENRNVDSCDGFGHGYGSNGLDSYSNRSNVHFDGNNNDGNARTNFRGM